MRPAPAVPILLLALAAAGCISIGGGDEGAERRSYDLSAPLPEGRPVPADGPEVLSVEPFSVDPALDREELVWRSGPVESGAWDRFRWVRPPEQGVREVLAAALARSGAVAAVATEPPAPEAEFRLRGHLARCDEEDGPAGWSGVLEVRIEVRDFRTGEVLLRRTYARREKAAARNPTAVVEAIRRSLDAVGLELATDLRTALEARREGEGPGGMPGNTEDRPLGR